MYTGVPGSGKSYALVSQVIIPAMLKGRSIKTNIDGLDPDKVRRYCAKHADLKGPLGSIELFDGQQAQHNDFWPPDVGKDDETFVKGGDLIVFDEWRLYFSNREKLTVTTLEPFLRIHRHLTNHRGDTCDVVIGSQLVTDLHRDFRGLCEGSYKFRKLKALGLPKVYQWDYYEGHTQPKGGRTSYGRGNYKPEVFALYSSYSGGADGNEHSTDSRQSIWGKSTYFLIAAVAGIIGLGVWGMWSFFFPDPPAGAAVASNDISACRQQNYTAASPSRSRFRIAGHMIGDQGVRVVLVDDAGSIRVVDGSGFDMQDGRPVSGIVDGQKVSSEDRFKVSSDVVEFGS